jgi:hypothetical protein
VRSVGIEVEDLYEAVFGWLERYADHEPDWADGELVVLSERIAGTKVWTYDTEFWKIWRSFKGKRVPLFVDPRSPSRAKNP